MTLSSNPTTSLRSPAAELRGCRTETCERAARPESPWCSACFRALLSGAFAPPPPRAVVRLSEIDPFCIAAAAASRSTDDLTLPGSASMGTPTPPASRDVIVGRPGRRVPAASEPAAAKVNVHVAAGASTAGPGLSLRAAGRPFAGS